MADYLQKKREEFIIDTREEHSEIAENANIISTSTRNLNENIIKDDGMREKIDDDENLSIIQNNMEEEVELDEEIQAPDYSTAESRKAAITAAYQRSGHEGNPNKLNDRQKKMDQKLKQRDRIKAYKPVKNTVPAQERQMPMDDATIEETVAEYMNAIKQVNISSNEKLAANFESIMETLNSIEMLKDSVRKELCNRELGQKVKEDCDVLFETAEILRRYMDVHRKMITNDYYALLARADSDAMTVEELRERSADLKKENPKLSQYYNALADVREMSYYGKKTSAMIREARNLEKKKGIFADMEREAEALQREEERNTVEEVTADYQTQLKSEDMFQASQEHVYNRFGTAESRMLYGSFFQFSGEKSSTQGAGYSDQFAYFNSSYAKTISKYANEDDISMRKRKAEIEKDLKWKAEIERELNGVEKPKLREDEERAEEEKMKKMVDDEYQHREETIKPRVDLLKQATKADTIPENTMLYKMTTKGALRDFGVREGDSPREIVRKIKQSKNKVIDGKGFESAGYRVDKNRRNLPVMFTILTDKGRKCMISANTRKAELVFHKPVYEVLTAEVCENKEIPVSDPNVELKEWKRLGKLNESTETFTGINIVVHLKTSAAEDDYRDYLSEREQRKEEGEDNRIREDIIGEETNSIVNTSDYEREEMEKERREKRKIIEDDNPEQEEEKETEKEREKRRKAEIRQLREDTLSPEEIEEKGYSPEEIREVMYAEMHWGEDKKRKWRIKKIRRLITEEGHDDMLLRMQGYDYQEILEARQKIKG